MQFIDLKAQQTHIRKNIEKRIQTVLDHGKYIMGPEVFELEEKLAEYVGVKHCISCSSGTDALLIPLMAKRIGAGDAVLTTPFTFIATAEVIALLGATPIFVDIYPETFNIDPAGIDDAVTLAKITARNVSNAKLVADTITVHELDNHVESGLNPIGSIIAYGANAAPTGYYLCDGSAISRTGVNANLFSIIGTHFGVGNGNNTFNVPKLDDAFLLGKGSNNTLVGTQTHSMSASATKASESTSLSAHSLTSASFATSAKDSSTATAATAVADHAAITPNMIFPTVVVNFIIRF